MAPGGDLSALPMSALVEAAPYGVAVFDLDARYVYVNQHLALLNGLPAAAHVGRHPLELFPGPAVEEWVRLVERVLASGQPIGPIRFAAVSADARAWFDVAYHPVTDQGSVVGVVATVRDVSLFADAERRQAAVTTTIQAISAAVDAAGIARAVVENVGGRLADRVAFASRSGTTVTILALSGYPADVEEQVAGLVIPLTEQRPLIDAIRAGQTIVLDADAFAREYPGMDDLRRRVGDQVVVSVPVWSEGEVVGGLLCGWATERPSVTADVDAMLALAAVAGAGLRRVLLSEALQNDRFERALQASVDGIAITRSIRDDDGRIVDFEMVWANDASTDAYGRQVPRLVGQRVREVYPAFESSGLLHRFIEVVETGVPFRADEHPYHDTSADPPVEGWHQLHVVPFDDGYLASSRDVTEAVCARRALVEAEVTAESERLATALLQRIGQPARLPALPWIDIAAVYEAFDERSPIGGDWYDVFELDDGRVGLVVGDVAGHGRDAVTSMVEVRSLMGAAARAGSSPAAAMAAVRALRLSEPSMATCLYVLVDAREGSLTAASAGHLPPLLCSADGQQYVPVPVAPPLGFGDDRPDTEVRVALPAEATVVLFTDGLVERRGELIDVGLAQLAARVSAGTSPAELCEHLVVERSLEHLTDDFCIVAARIHLHEAT